jgi:L-lactate dehydrogenase complex protein LldE
MSHRVGLFATCLVDFFRPSVGFAAVKLLEANGCQVEVPEAQTCCGQPAYNSGDKITAARMARRIIDVFGGYDYVVIPSGSCGGMIAHHFPKLLADDPQYAEKSKALAAKSFELLTFLVEVLKLEKLPVHFEGVVTYHDSCSGLRELGIKSQPRRLLAGVSGLELREMSGAEECCGFGGTFCVKYPEISDRMVSDKVTNVVASGAKTVLGGDMGCLLNIAGKLKREGSLVQVRHIAEVLAEMTENPAIGEGKP